ncbi:MAG: DHH family phosphoesterase [Candidatus Aenigmarchaeota archaeon]|nr:DHH family phosphoesterase [Candidatus Aenigmarchaeota archaeon]
MQRLVEKIKKISNEKTLIITHHNADIDAISSAIALYLGLKQLKIPVSIGVSESISRPAKKIANDYNILIDPDCSKFKNIILVDTSVSEQLKTIKNLRADIIIDHHPKGDLVNNNISLIDPNKKSCSELIYALLKKLKININKKIAKIILAGMVADTAHLKLAEKEQFKVILELLETGVMFSDVLKLLETPQDVSEVIAGLKAIKNSNLYKIGDLLISFSKIGSHEAYSCRLFIKYGVDIAIVFAIKKNELRISSRGKKRILDLGISLSEIFKEIGHIIDGSGGGHDLAGSANGKSKNIEEVEKFILNTISKKLNKKIKKLY